MTRLVYSEAELMSDHPFAQQHVVAGSRMHGGMMHDGTYQPPRALLREPALQAWTDALRARGGDLLDADSSLLDGEKVPGVEQSRVLLRNGLGETFWNGLTITGKIEAKGRLLAEMVFPELGPFIVEDVSEMAIGHLNKGLLKAHGLDEGGLPDEGIGGHDVMWFVARDLALGANAYPDVEPPENISRPDSAVRRMPEVSAAVEGFISFLMNLLVIEFRAEIGFAATQAVLRTPDLFADRRADAEEAAEIIGRIRTDEEIHVSSLRLYLGELASVTFKTLDGGTVAGRDLIDRFWGGLVHWATVEQPPLASQMQRELIESRIMAAPNGAQILAEFRSAGSD
ncbi:MAG: hypothetical protein WCJ32_06635 [Actinomycetota bacterium]